jgi:hypothetical protein
MDWLDLAQDMERWRTLVSKVMNLQVPPSLQVDDMVHCSETKSTLYLFTRKYASVRHIF